MQQLGLPYSHKGLPPLSPAQGREPRHLRLPSPSPFPFNFP